jgi:hypothetical protein
MDIVLDKQRELIAHAKLPKSDILFLQNTQLFDPHDHELHKCCVQRAANHLSDDAPLALVLAPDGAGQRVLEAQVFAANDAAPLRFGDVVGPRPTVVITVSVT